MTDLKSDSTEDQESKVIVDDTSPKKGPINFFSGAITSIFLAWFCWGISTKSVQYFTTHSFDYTSPIAQSVASGFKTLVIGICFLATFTFAFIGCGLILVFIRSLFDANSRVDS